jgi:hypothetical protein
LPISISAPKGYAIVSSFALSLPLQADPKVGQQEPVVQNGIVALSTLHEDYQTWEGKFSNRLIDKIVGFGFGKCTIVTSSNLLLILILLDTEEI